MYRFVEYNDGAESRVCNYGVILALIRLRASYSDPLNSIKESRCYNQSNHSSDATFCHTLKILFMETKIQESTDKDSQEHTSTNTQYY